MFAFSVLRSRLFPGGFWRAVKLELMMRHLTPKDIKDTICRQVAWCLPKRIVYWALVRGIAHGTCGKYGSTIVPEFAAMDAIKRWGDDHQL